MALPLARFPGMPSVHIFETLHMGVSRTKGYFFGGLSNEDYDMLGFMLGSPTLRKYHIRFLEISGLLRAHAPTLTRRYTASEHAAGLPFAWPDRGVLRDWGYRGIKKQSSCSP